MAVTNPQTPHKSGGGLDLGSKVFVNSEDIATSLMNERLARPRYGAEECFKDRHWMFNSVPVAQGHA